VILILANPQDVHARRVCGILQERKEPVHILDSGEFGSGALLSYSLGKSCNVIDDDGVTIDLETVHTVWYRRPRISQIGKTVSDMAVRQFCQQEWASLLDGLFINSSARFINPLLSEFAAVKPRQLHVANAIGLDIPDTLISNDPEEVSGFIEKYRGQVIHKAMSSPKDRFFDTRLWSEEDRQALVETLPLAPTIFQELVRGPADVRVTMVGDRLFAVRISTEEGRAGIDSRLDLDVPYAPHQLPADLSSKLHAFMDSMGLVYGTIDLKINDQGEYVFLEVNSQGQFLYVEILAGMPIADAVADLLANTNQAHRLQRQRCHPLADQCQASK
jgi:hypothetical protein